MQSTQFGYMAVLLSLPVLACAQGVGMEYEKFPGQLLQTGHFEPSYINAKTGQKWLALLREADRHWKLVPVTIRVEDIRQENHPPDLESIETKVSIKGRTDKDVFLVRKIPGLIAGPIETIPTPKVLLPNIPLRLVLKSGATYLLTLECTQPDLKEKREPGLASLVLKRGRIKQTLSTWSFEYNDGKILPDTLNGVGLRWAGDLNGDGALDLIIDLSQQYCFNIPTLFLGNPTPTKPLVSKVANFKNGC